VDSNATDILAHYLAFAGAETGTDFNSKVGGFRRYWYKHNAAGCRTVEGGQNTIAGTLDLMTTKSRKVALDHGEMIVEKTAPAAIAKGSSFLVEPMSVNNTVAGIRSTSTGPRVPVRKSSVLEDRYPTKSTGSTL
jgi:hypothetical protein